MLAKLEHPNIVRLYDTFELAGHLCLACELVEGGPLRERLEPGRPLPPADALRWMRGLLAGLRCCHEAGVVHRDLKPENVLLTRQDVVRLADFGIAKDFGGDGPSLTETRALIGTPRYMAPEVVRGETAFEPADVWAAGVIFHEMLTGTAPFDARTLPDLFEAILHGPTRPVASLAPGVPPAVAALIDRMLSKDPLARPATAGEVLDLLRDAAPSGSRSRPVRVPSRALSSVAPAAPPAAGRAAGALCAIALLVAGALGYRAWMQGGAGLVAPSAATPSSPAPSPGAAAAARAPALLRVPQLAVHAVERTVYVWFRTAAPAECEVALVGGPAPVSAGGGCIHRAVLEGLSPGTEYRLELRSRDPARPIRHEPVPVRTMAAGTIKNIRLTSETIDLGDAGVEAPATLRDLQQIWQDSDVPSLVRTLAQTGAPAQRDEALCGLRAIANPASVPAVIAYLRAQPPDEPPGLVFHAIEVLGRAGGDAAHRELVRRCNGDVAARSEVERAALHEADQEAAYLLAAADPDGARELFARLARDPAPRAVVLRGAARLGADALDVALRPLLETRWAELGEEARAAALRATMRRRTDAGLALLERVALDPAATDLERASADCAIASWSGLAVLPALCGSPDVARATATSPVPAGRTAWLASLRAVQAIGEVAGRSAGSANRTGALDALGRVAGGPDVVMRRAALRALARLGDPRARDAVEGAYQLFGTPSAELAIALARTGSTRARDAVAKLVDGGKPSDLWMAAVALAALGGDARLDARVDAAIAGWPRSEARGRLEADVTWLRGGGLARRPLWLDPEAPWVAYGPELRAGDAFGVIAHGCTARRAPAARSPLSAAPDADATPEKASALLGPGGGATGYFKVVSTPQCRVGEHVLPSPLDPARRYVAQDDGVPLFYMVTEGGDEPEALRRGDEQWLPLEVSGLLLVELRRD